VLKENNIFELAKTDQPSAIRSVPHSVADQVAALRTREGRFGIDFVAGQEQKLVSPRI
jgi:hypothetical protein